MTRSDLLLKAAKDNAAAQETSRGSVLDARDAGIVDKPAPAAPSHVDGPELPEPCVYYDPVGKKTSYVALTNKGERRMSDPLAVDCPNCGKPGRGLSHCNHCDEFIPMTLALPDDDQLAGEAPTSSERMAIRELAAAKLRNANARADAIAAVLQDAKECIEAFTDPEDEMPEDTGEFRDLKRVLVRIRAIDAARKEKP